MIRDIRPLFFWHRNLLKLPVILVKKSVLLAICLFRHTVRQLIMIPPMSGVTFALLTIYFLSHFGINRTWLEVKFYLS